MVMMHGQHTIGRCRVGEVDLFAADGLVAYEVIDAGASRSVGLELGILPRFAIVPLGVGHPRHIREPAAHNPAVDTFCRVITTVVSTRHKAQHETYQ